MDITRDYHTKWSNSKEKDKCPPWDTKKERENTIWYYLYVELKYGPNEPIYKEKQSHKHGEQTSCQGVGR